MYNMNSFFKSGQVSSYKGRQQLHSQLVKHGSLVGGLKGCVCVWRNIYSDIASKTSVHCAAEIYWS